MLESSYLQLIDEVLYKLDITSIIIALSFGVFVINSRSFFFLLCKNKDPNKVKEVFFSS
jgi:hypothetical protein